MATKPKTETFADGGYDLSEGELDEYERVETGIGEKIEWADTPIFMGTYRGTQMVGIDPETSNNGEEEAKAHLFTARNGDDVFAWATAQLDLALEGLVGRDVRIEWLGKVDIKQGRSVNRFKVLVRKSA